MEESTIHEFDPVIYPYKLWVIIAGSPDIVAKKFDEYGGKPILFVEGDVDRSEAFTMPVRSKNNAAYGVVIFLRTKRSLTFNLVAHESSHAAKYLFDHIGADVDPHEPFKYVVGWIAGCLGKVKANQC